jgi:hypothetical protein
VKRDIYLEEQMHQEFTPWVADHALGSHGIISDTGYDPVKFPAQRIDAARTPALIESAKRPERVLTQFYDQYARIMRGWGQARAQIEIFRRAQTTEDSGNLLINTVADYLEDGKNIGLITDHAEGLFDMAKGLGGLSLAISAGRGSKYIGSFNSWVNKLMTRQYYKQEKYGATTGKKIEENVYIPSLLSIGGGIRWVIPDTDNGKRYILEDAISKAVNIGALTSFAQDKKAGRGTVEVMVPAGTRMLPKKDDNGRIEHLVSPRIPESSANLLAHLDALVIFSSWSGRTAVSNLVELQFASKRERADKTPQVAQQIRELMRKQTEAVSGLRVVLAEELETAA